MRREEIPGRGTRKLSKKCGEREAVLIQEHREKGEGGEEGFR